MALPLILLLATATYAAGFIPWAMLARQPFYNGADQITDWNECFLAGEIRAALNPDFAPVHVAGDSL